ncbi:alpha-hydroxy-acid oxidizing protein [Bradyrhizobium sp. 160]|nr:alpha-hydroxy-acid oxidizing protein [Bradyrhizobium sp. 179]MCK1623308.1 alpha-hydroxy-acid oxidizing protein [Bradyrhizobium sp. 160]
MPMLLNASDYRRRARRFLPRGLFDYIDRGSEDETALTRLRASLDAITLVPAVLTGQDRRDLDTVSFGRRIAAPLVVAPTALACAGGGSAAGRYQHETTTATVEKLERWLHDQPEAKIVTSYVGQGAPRFAFAMAPELPDPAFAKVVVLTPHTEAREDLKHRLGQAVSQGLAPEANVRVTQLVFGPYTPFPVEFRVMGPDPAQLYAISEKALGIMRGVPDVRQANRDWGDRKPVLRFIPDQDRLNLIGLSPAEVGRQLQFLLTGTIETHS